MKSWIRIIAIVLVLVGGVSGFGYWSMGQFNDTLDNLAAAYVAVVPVTYATPEPEPDAALEAPQLYGALTTSIEADTEPTSGATVTKTKSKEFAFTFPTKNSNLYIGCTYNIMWQAPATTTSLGVVIVDANTRALVPHTASDVGVGDEETKLTGLTWEVKDIVPGTFYIKASNINGTDTDARSDVFAVQEKPQTENANEDVCSTVDES